MCSALELCLNDILTFSRRFTIYFLRLRRVWDGFNDLSRFTDHLNRIWINILYLFSKVEIVENR